MKTKTIMIILGVVLIISIVSNIYYYNIINEEIKNQQDFFTDYIIAINDYHIAEYYFYLGSLNLERGNLYVDEGYYYEDVIDFYDVSKENLLKSETLLIHSQSKLTIIKDTTPNIFYQEEIKKRFDQGTLLLDLSRKRYLLSDYMDKQLYEVNYGSETEAIKYLDMYNDLIPEINDNLQKLSDVSQEIDLSWDQDWYNLLEGV